MEDNCFIIKLYEEIQSGSVDIPGSSSHAFVFLTYKTVEFLVWLERNKRDFFRPAHLHEWNTGLKWLLLKAFHELLEDSDYNSLSNDVDLDYPGENKWWKEPAALSLPVPHCKDPSPQIRSPPPQVCLSQRGTAGYFPKSMARGLPLLYPLWCSSLPLLIYKSVSLRKK